MDEFKEFTSSSVGRSQDDGRAQEVVPKLRHGVVAIEEEARLDELADRVAGWTRPLSESALGDTLRGEWAGHALHPAMTDLPLGCWLAAGALDVVGGRKARRASQRLVGLGILLAVPTALTGAAEYSRLDDPKARRVATTHAAGNAAALLCQMGSWRSRRRGHHLRGMLWSTVGLGLASGSGYLGAHLSFARGVGMGPRGDLDRRGNEAPPRRDDDADDDARTDDARTAGPNNGPVLTER